MQFFRTPPSSFTRPLGLVALVVLAGVQARLAGAQPSAPPSTLTVQVDQPGARIPDTLFGLFFEDVNFGADGGLYPERVKNRSFEFPDPLMGWKQLDAGSSRGTVQVLEQGVSDDSGNVHYLRLQAGSRGQTLGISNEGFRGIGVEKGAEYIFSVRARHVNGEPVRLRVELIGAGGSSLGRATLEDITPAWETHTATLRATGRDAQASLNLRVEGSGALDLDLVSLYPKDTWRDRKNGLRPDLVRLLKDMKPGFLRFPGGCIVEGRRLDTRYQWKTTLGDPDERRLIVNRWNSEFRHRPAPDYYQSFGLGYFEYFQLSEDIGAEPLPILNCGMACQFNSGELAPLDELDTYIQDALDLVEFANGPVASEWGGKRAAMGHPKPFKLKMIGIGNEQWGPQYIERYREFARVLKAKHPEIALISSAGPSPSGEQFDYLWARLRELKADIVDEHYYMAPKWFRDNAGRYDSYPRNGPKVFAGEYASQSVGIASPNNRNNWEGALSEAAFVTGLERNADIVQMTSYAPLFGHVDAWQWTPNLIWFDNLRSYGTPNYYVQKLFSANRGTKLLPVRLDGSAKNGAGDLFTSASLDEAAGEVILKVVNVTPAAREVRVRLAGAKNVRKKGQAFVLANSDPKAENSLDEPMKVAPVAQPFEAATGEFTYRLLPNSLTVLRVGVAGGRVRR